MRKIIALSVALVGAACVPQQTRPTTTPDAQSAPTKPKITAVQLLGQAEHWVVDKLGAPTFVRTDMHANIWQYKNGHCVLNVFLYAGQPSDPAPAKVLHFDARDARGQDTDRDACLSALQN